MNKIQSGSNESSGSEEIVLSIITPAFNEEDNLPVLFQRLSQVLDPLHLLWEWIIVDDHSDDNTFSCITKISSLKKHIKGIRFSKNSGSHTALACGLHQASGNCAVVIAADLQDPPELIPDFIQQWKKGAHIIWGTRRMRPGDPIQTIGFSRIYFYLMRRFVGLQDMPPTGSDFFLLDRQVVKAFCQFAETNVSTMGLLTWLGFEQSFLPYDKNERLHGTSGWNFEKKIKIIVDSITAFTYKPIRIMSYMGFCTALSGFCCACIVFFKALFIGTPVLGYPSLMVAILVIGGMQMLMLGLLGEYLWRALDEARRRPRYIMEAMIGDIQEPSFTCDKIKN